jgi:hypothetical protein
MPERFGSRATAVGQRSSRRSWGSCCVNIRSMPRMVLPERGLDLIAGAFDPVLPDGIYLVLDGRQVWARTRRLPPLPAWHFGGTYPPRFLSEWTRARIQISDLCEQVAGSIGRAHAGWTSDAAEWPWVGAKTTVERNDDNVIVTFVGGTETESLRLGPICWEGPWLVPKGSPLAQREPRQLRYVGDVPEEHRQADQQRRAR